MTLSSSLRDMTFTRYDLYELQQGEINSVAKQLGLPHLAIFVASVCCVQAMVAEGTLRHDKH